MSLQYNPTLIGIVTAFQKQGLASNSYYSREQYQVALDRMCGGQFDRAVLEQLFEQCNTNQKQQVLLEDFAHVFIEADRILKRKISQCNDDGEQYTKSLEECRHQHNDSKYNQQVNQQGVEKDSLLTIVLHEAQGIRSAEDFSMSFVHITVGKTQHISNGSQGGDKSNPLYNQQFQFLIETGQEDVNFKLFVVGRSQQQTQVGEVTMELSDLHDQEIHEIKLQLRDGRGPLGTTLIIDAQWMYNKIKYHSQMMTRYQESLQLLKEDMDDFLHDLQTIQEPFSHIKQLPQLQSQRRSPTNQMDVRPPNQSDARPPIQELHQGLVLILLIGIFSLFECFARPAFVDLLLFLLLLIIVVRDHFEPQHIKTVAAINIVSMAYDIIWLSFYQKEWNIESNSSVSNSSESDSRESFTTEYGQSIMRVTLVFAILNLIAKGILCYYLHHFYRESLTKQVFYFQLGELRYEVGRHRYNIFVK